MLKDSRHADLRAAPAARRTGRRGLAWSAAEWTPTGLRELLDRLERGRATLDELGPDRRLAAWSAAVEAVRGTGAAGLRRALAMLCGLSVAGLEAGLTTMLDGVAAPVARDLFRAARSRSGRPGAGPLLVVLASNVPGLAVQTLLPALAVGRPVLVKSSSSEPLFAPYFVDLLARREPLLGEAVAAVTWAGGDPRLEEPVLAAAGKVIAYGGEPTLGALRARLGDRLVGFGPMASLAVLGADVEAAAIAPGLARDIALFDQRGCLSIQAVYTAGDPVVLARELAAALDRQAETWPMGSTTPEAAAAVRQLRDEATMRGLLVADLPLRRGTVVVEPDSPFRPSPGLRTVRVHPLPDLAVLPELLRGWSGRLQGVAVAGARVRELEPDLRRLGVTRLAAPGELQATDASWANGGLPPLDAVS